jgi:hypothetical protein
VVDFLFPDTQQGWTTPEKMLAASWEERTRVLNQSGYARYDESTSTKLAAASELLINEFGGDLRQLRERVRRDPAKEQPSLIGWRLSLPNAFVSPRRLRNLQGSPGKSNFPACLRHW